MKQKATQKTETLRAAGRSIWLAGVGAAMTFGEEAGDIFDRLVEKGRKIEGRELQDVRKAFGRAGDRAKDVGTRLGDKAEEGVTAVLHRFGVPTRHEIQKLITRVEQLTAKVDDLAAQG